MLFCCLNILQWFSNGKQRFGIAMLGHSFGRAVVIGVGRSRDKRLGAYPACLWAKPSGKCQQMSASQRVPNPPGSKVGLLPDGLTEAVIGGGGVPPKGYLMTDLPN
jgi:hypothetical protein